MSIKGFGDELGSMMLDDLRKIGTNGAEIGDYVEKYLGKAIDRIDGDPKSKQALRKAALAIADTIEGHCPAGLVPTPQPQHPPLAMVYGPDTGPGQVMFCAATSMSEAISCTVSIDGMPDDDWPMLAEAKNIGAGYSRAMLNGSLWSGLVDLIEEDHDQKFEAMVNVTCLRIGLSSPGALTALKHDFKTIMKVGFVPLFAAICHRKSADAVIAAFVTLFLPMSLGAQIERLEGAAA